MLEQVFSLFKRRTIIRLLFLSFGLAVYELFFKESYHAWLRDIGEYGVGEVAFGYFIAFVTSWVVAWLFTRGGEG